MSDRKYLGWNRVSWLGSLGFILLAGCGSDNTLPNTPHQPAIGTQPVIPGQPIIPGQNCGHNSFWMGNTCVYGSTFAVACSQSGGILRGAHCEIPQGQRGIIGQSWGVAAGIGSSFAQIMSSPVPAGTTVWVEGHASGNGVSQVTLYQNNVIIGSGLGVRVQTHQHGAGVFAFVQMGNWFNTGNLIIRGYYCVHSNGATVLCQ